MPRILLLGRSATLLQMLANILTVRGSQVSAALDENTAREVVAETPPELVIWDQEPGDDALEPGRLGYNGPVLILAPPSLYLWSQPQGRVLIKPVGLDQLVQAVQDLTAG